MIDLGDRTIYPDGTVICRQAALVERLYTGEDLAGVLCNDSEDADEWQQAMRLCDNNAEGPTAAVGEIYTDVNWYDHWITPEPYRSIDLHKWLSSDCVTEEQQQRVTMELLEMQRRNMYPLIQHLIYCVDIWRKNGVVWGVGRGSSVCSYVLYLVGVNRINPLEHGLDLAEWLK